MIVRWLYLSCVRCLLVALLCFGVNAALPPGAAAQSGSLQGFSTSSLEIVTSGGRHAFRVEVAETDSQRSQGLMFRPVLAADAGMLFIYPTDRHISMWMKNTLIPLDMVFIAADGRVVGFHERAVPHSLRPIGSGAPARAVLELPGGTVSRLGIRPGDRVISPNLAGAG
jgi:hypothetical protein